MTDWKNIGTRAAWTGLQAVAAYAITVVTPLSGWWAAPLALVLSSGKTWLTEQLSKGGKAV